MHEYSLISCRSSDVVSLLEKNVPALLSQLYRAVGWDANASRTPDRCARMLATTGFVVCAFKENELVGFGRLLLDEFAACVFDVIVRPEHRRKGIATSIMHEITRFLDREARYGFLIDGSNAGELYEGVGFHAEGGERVMYRANQPPMI